MILLKNYEKLFKTINFIFGIKCRYCIKIKQQDPATSAKTNKNVRRIIIHNFLFLCIVISAQSLIRKMISLTKYFAMYTDNKQIMSGWQKEQL
jgi:hypothetical protein